MKIRTPSIIPPYWDDGNWNMVKWFRKGKWKRILRKRWIKKVTKINYDQH